MFQFAEAVRKVTESNSELVFAPLPTDDPKQRCPDISKAKRLLGWEPTMTLSEGLVPTVGYFRKELAMA